MRYSVSELRGVEIWPEEVIGFLPFVGLDYHQGIDGVRVLLLAESHYVKNPSELLKIRHGVRGYTRAEFEECQTKDWEGSRSWNTFFRRLDSIVARSEKHSEADAAAMWRRVAYSNFVQRPVGSTAQCRPDHEGWASGTAAFPVLLDRLSPDAILVIGRQTFNQTPDSGKCIGNLSTRSVSVPRTLWEMESDGRKALMTWIYHPCARYPRDSIKTSIDVFDSLIRRARGMA